MARSESPDTRLLHSLIRRRLALLSIYSAQRLRDREQSTLCAVNSYWFAVNCWQGKQKYRCAGSVSYQCRRKTCMVHHTFVWRALYIPHKFVKSPTRHLGLAIGNVRCVRRFSPTLVISAGFICEGSIKASISQYSHYLKSRFGNIVFWAMNWFADLGMHLTSMPLNGASAKWQSRLSNHVLFTSNRTDYMAI